MSRLLLRKFSQTLKDPLTHFVMIGALVFWWNDATTSNASNHTIHFDQATIEHLAEEFQHRYQHPPNQDELHAMIQNKALDIILHREGIKQGLDKNDDVIKSRIVQKMNFLIEAQAIPNSPSLTDLHAYLENNKDRFSTPERFDVVHIFFANHPNKARQSLVTLNQGKPLHHKPSPFIKGNAIKGATTQQISLFLGTDQANLQQLFANGVATRENQSWLGPIKGQYGYHLIQINQHYPKDSLSLSSHRDKIYKAWKKDQSLANIHAIKKSLLAQYDISMDSPYAGKSEKHHVAMR